MSDELAIRAKPHPVRRFSKKVLMVGAGGLALILSTALAFALQTPEHETVKNTELYNTTHKPVAEALEKLPKSYAEVTPASYPKLGPPLPGDLGAAYMGSNIVPGENAPENPFRFDPHKQTKGRPTPAYQTPRTYAPQPRTPPNVQPDPAEARQQEIRSASLFFDIGKNGSAKPQAQLTHNSFGDYGDPLLSNYQADMQTMMNMAGLYGGMGNAGSANQNASVQTITPQVGSADIYNKGQLQSPKSPYQVMAGTLISASLVTGLNSDLPGNIIGQVTENVYDTVSGQHLLIPQGAKLIGTYESRNAYGNTRAFVSWSRLIFPNGNSIALDDLGAVDGQGFAGLKDKVNNHYGKLVGAAALSSVLGVGAELAGDQDDRYIRAIQLSGQDNINMAGQRVIDRSLNVEPTITIRPGWRFKVLVSRDLILKPYSN